MELEITGGRDSFDTLGILIFWFVIYPYLPKHDLIAEVARRTNDKQFNLVNIADSILFTCNNQYHDQIDGLFVGSTISPAYPEFCIKMVEGVHVYSCAEVSFIIKLLAEGLSVRRQL